MIYQSKSPDTLQNSIFNAQEILFVYPLAFLHPPMQTVPFSHSLKSA